MRYYVGDLFNVAKEGDTICITTNGFVKENGECVMGRGIALIISRVKLQNCRTVCKYLGSLIKTYGNRCFNLGIWNGITLASFVVKHNWWENADIELIKTSCKQIMEMADKWKWSNIYLPQPGCGNGKLNWEDVKPVIEPLLDDRFIICSFK